MIVTYYIITLIIKKIQISKNSIDDDFINKFYDFLCFI